MFRASIAHLQEDTFVQYDNMNLMYTQTRCLNLRHTHSFNILDCNNT